MSKEIIQKNVWDLIKVAAVIGTAACVGEFFTVPYHTLAVNDPSYLITFTIMLITAFVTSALTIRAKLLTKEAQEKAMESNILYMLSKQLSDAVDIKEIISVTADGLEIRKRFSSTHTECYESS